MGTNIILSGATAFNSYHTESRILYSYTNAAEQNILDLNLDAVNEYIKENSSIYCAADFQTSLRPEQQYQGNYGIIFALDFLVDPTGSGQGEEITKYFILDINNMSGNPYRFLQPTKQYAFFDIDNTNFIRVNSITAFVENFPIQDNTETNFDIFITNIVFQAANKMSSNELAGYSINLNTPEGTVFDLTATQDSILPIAATVKYQGIEIESTDIEYYWFIENATIKTDSQYYNLNGGVGWKCLNAYTTTEDGAIQWTPSGNSIDIKISDAIARNNKIKCVAIYASNTISKELTIKNYLSSNVTLVTDTDTTTVYYGAGNVFLTCLIDGVAQDGEDYTYTWIQQDDNGTQQIDETSNRYEVIVGALSNYAIFKCAVTHNDVYIGTASITLTVTTESEYGYTLTILNGTQVFKYDENGTSPTSQSNETPLELKPLKLQLSHSITGAVPDEVLENCQIAWEIPQEDTLLIVEDTSLSGIELSYDIADSYSYQKTNNTITATVKYRGQSLTAHTNFLFLKDGDPGTNGTNFVCKIVPNVADNAQMPNNIIYEVSTGTLNYTPMTSPQQWVRAQLWENGEILFDGTQSDENFSLRWSILGNKYDYDTSDVSDLSIDMLRGVITCHGYSENQENDVIDIIKVVITHDGIDYSAVYPIILANTKNSSYNISVPENAGYKFVTYSSDGRTPQYDKNNPFEIHVFNGEVDVSDDQNITYTWRICGTIYEDEQWVKQELLKVKEQLRNLIDVTPNSSYDGQCVSIGLECVIALNDEELGRVHIPIYFGLNKYGLAALNGWDGNTIQADAEGGFILSPQIGAGRKEDDNSYTGLFMGEVKEGSSSSKKVGIFGYNKGQRSIFLDAETGTAEFGVAGKGQVIIDPTDNTALIKSGNYVPGQSGMAIDLTTPEIRFGNGKFVVNKDGTLNADEGTLGASGSQKIHLGGSVSNSYIYSGSKSYINANTNGFYLGTDGLALGSVSGSYSAFQVDTSGNVHARNVAIQSGNGSGRVELSASGSQSTVGFYYNNSQRGYIRGGSNGLEIYGYPTYIGGSSMDISASTMSITSNRLYLTPGTLIVNTGRGTGVGVTATYQLLTNDTRVNPAPVVLAVAFPTLTKHYINATFYQGIFVQTSSGSEEQDSND